MSRKTRETQKIFKVFCEGDTEFNYVDGMRKKLKLSIALKPVNMEGGGYSNFLDKLKIDSNTNCLAKFIIIDGDRAINEKGEKNNLIKLLEYCKLQNSTKKVPHILIVNYPDFEYIACMHNPKYKGQKVEQFIIKEMGYKDVNEFKSDKKIYDVLNINGNSSAQMLLFIKRDNSLVTNKCNINKSKYDIKAETTYNIKNLGRKGTNINEYFEIIDEFK